MRRIELEPSTQRVVVRDGGEILADSSRPLLLHEGDLPTRYYLPPEDVRLDRLDESGTLTRCPWKGRAHHYARGGRDVAWTYRDPKPRVAAIEGLIAFYGERVEIEHTEPRP
jgi:uncharacterized protein (DUF427 family)